MLKGIYSATAAMAAEMKRQQTIANNLANVGTTGYKQDSTTIASFPSMLMWRVSDNPAAVGELGTGVMATETPVDLGQGALRRTDRPLDVALVGRGFFSVRTEQGDLLTRAGAFTVDAGGQLVTTNGDAVLGANGPITLPNDDITITADGTIYAGGQRIDRLLIVDATEGARVVKVGDNLLSVQGGTAQPVAQGEVSVLQGQLEEANVDTVGAMTGLMAALRAYESAQRALKMQDQTLQRAIEELGRA